MAINVQINVDLSNLSQRAIEQAVADRAAQIQSEEEAKIKREALEAKTNRLEERRQDSKGIEDMPTWRSKPPRLELSSYAIKQKNWNMMWFRVENAPSQRRLRAYISNSEGSSFRELNLDWAMESSLLPINGDPASPVDEEIPTPSSYLESFLPDWVEPKNLHKVDDMPPFSTFVVPRIVAGNNANGFSLAKQLDNWIYNPWFMGLSLSKTGPFVQVQRVLWEKIQDSGGTRIALLPLIDDIAVAVVFTETIVKSRSIDFFRIKQGGGTIAANSPRSVSIPSVYRYAQSIRGNGEQGTQETPTWEFLIGRIPGGFGAIKSVTARMAPRNPEGEQIADGTKTIGLTNFDQTHSIKFALCTSGSFPQHYRQYYADKDVRSQQAKIRTVLTDAEKDKTKWTWAPCKFVSPIMTIGTDPRVYHPSPFLPDGQVNNCDGTGYDLSKRGWDDTEYYSDLFYNYSTGTTTNKRVYRGWSKTWGSETGQTPATFKAVYEGDYLFVRILEVEWNNQSSYCQSQYGTTRIAPYEEITEGDRYTGNHNSPQNWTESLYLTIELEDGSAIEVNLSGGNTVFNYKETAHVMQDSELISYHNDVNGVEPTVRCFVVSDVALEEIEPPQTLKANIGQLFNRLYQQGEDEFYAANILEGENQSNLSYGDYADSVYHYKYGPLPGKNLLADGHGKSLARWLPFSPVPQGYSLEEDYGSPPVKVKSSYPGIEDEESVLATLPVIPRDALYSLGNNSYKSWMECASLNVLDYRGGQPLKGKSYIFSVYVKVNDVGAKDNGIYPDEVKECEGTLDDNGGKLEVTGEEGKALICLQQVVPKANKFYISKYTVQEVEIGSWYRIWMKMTCKGGDIFRIDNWNGNHLSYLQMEVFGPQLESTEKEKPTDKDKNDKPTDYLPRGDFAQVYRSGVYTDAVAKGNAYNSIGTETAGWVYDPNAIPVDGVFMSQGIGFESIYQQGDSGTLNAQSVVNNLGADSNSNLFPEEEGRVSKWSPAAYSDLGVESPITSGAYKSDIGGASTARCDVGAPQFNEGPLADRKNETFQSVNDQPATYYESLYKISNEKIETGKINSSSTNDYAGLNGSTSKVRMTSNNCATPPWKYGDLDASDPEYSVNGNPDYDSDRRLVSGCLEQGYSSDNGKYNSNLGKATGSMYGVNSAECVTYAQYGPGGTPLGAPELGGGSSSLAGTAEGAQGQQAERDQCKFIMDKAKKMQGWLKNQNYMMSELLLRGEATSLPGVIQYTSWGNLERNAKSLESLGFDAEVILGIGTNTPVDEEIQT
jgi:hypothetical protein